MIEQEKTYKAGLIMMDMNQQVFVGRSIEEVHDQARGWLKERGVVVPDGRFWEWYTSNAPMDVWFWESDQDVVITNEKEPTPL